MVMNATKGLTQLVSVAVASSLLASTALAEGPVGERIVAGFAGVARPDAQTTVITQSTDRAIINWDLFNIGADHAVRIIQPSASSAILNRVTGGDYSRIMGTLSANGTVALVNPEGILFGPNSIIDVGSLIATTHDIADADFMADRWVFDQPGNPSASIIHQGSITASEGGMAALVAPGVRNDGIIAARLGEATLASSQGGFTLDFYGDDLIQLHVGDDVAAQVLDVVSGQPLANLVDNQGTVSASGGTVHLTAAAARHVVDHVINNDGIIEADSVGVHNGLIVLGAATDVAALQQHPDQSVRISGEISARGTEPGQTGGQIQITGETIETARATIDASGAAGGGDILLGGSLQGGNPNPAFLVGLNAPMDLPPIPTARSAIIDDASIFDASAIEDGDGGNIIAWADDSMHFSGLARSRGGRLGGDGGFIEVSGRLELVRAVGDYDVFSPMGNHGTVLFDPTNLYISQAVADVYSRILTRGGNVVEYADTITVAGNIIRRRPPGFIPSPGHTPDSVLLRLTANNGITLKDGITIGSTYGPLDVELDASVNIESDVVVASSLYISNRQQLIINSIASIPDVIEREGYVPSQANRDSVERAGELVLAIYQIWEFPEAGFYTLSEWIDILIEDGAIGEHDGVSIEDFETFILSNVIDEGASILLNSGQLSIQPRDGWVQVSTPNLPDSFEILAVEPPDLVGGEIGSGNVCDTNVCYELVFSPIDDSEPFVNFTRHQRQFRVIDQSAELLPYEFSLAVEELSRFSIFQFGETPLTQNRVHGGGIVTEPGLFLNFSAGLVEGVSVELGYIPVRTCSSDGNVCLDQYKISLLGAIDPINGIEVKGQALLYELRLKEEVHDITGERLQAVQSIGVGVIYGASLKPNEAPRPPRPRFLSVSTDLSLRLN